MLDGGPMSLDFVTTLMVCRIIGMSIGMARSKAIAIYYSQ
jgi:hypothetical protein